MLKRMQIKQLTIEHLQTITIWLFAVSGLFGQLIHEFLKANPRLPSPLKIQVLVIGLTFALLQIISILCMCVDVCWGLKRKFAIARPPGYYHLAIVKFLCSRQMVATTFIPIIDEWRSESYSAIQQGATIQLRWMTLRYTFRFLEEAWKYFRTFFRNDPPK